jgi:hypothetical protein
LFAAHSLEAKGLSFSRDARAERERAFTSQAQFKANSANIQLAQMSED